MRTAARPTRLWNPATSSGISVILTRLAAYQPPTPPIATIGISSQKWPAPPNMVATTARPMPTMAYQIACLAFS